jgi:hypothetical protein
LRVTDVAFPGFPDRRIRAKDPDTPRIAYLLRVGGKRPRDNAATKTSNELPSLHKLSPARSHSGAKKYKED